MQAIQWVMLAGVAAGAVRLLFVRTVVSEGFAGLIYRNGRFCKQLGPGRYYLSRLTTECKFVDTRWQIVNVPGQEVLSKDNVGLRVTLAIAYRVSDPERWVHGIQDGWTALWTAAQLVLRAVVDGREIETILRSRGELGKEMLPKLAAEAASFGVEVRSVDVRDLTFPGELKRVFAEVVKAQQEGRATLERARSESAALRNLANAARLLESQPTLANVRILQAIADGSAGKTFVLGASQGLLPIGNAK